MKKIQNYPVKIVCIRHIYRLTVSGIRKMENISYHILMFKIVCIFLWKKKRKLHPRDKCTMRQKSFDFWHFMKMKSIWTWKSYAALCTHNVLRMWKCCGKFFCYRALTLTLTNQPFRLLHSLSWLTWLISTSKWLQAGFVLLQKSTEKPVWILKACRANLCW